MPFQKGNKFGKGRPAKPKTQVKDWIKEHPSAVATLMQVLYEKGIEGDREAAMYVIDRIKGKPKATVGIDEDDKELLGVGVVVKLFEMMEKKRRELETVTLLLEEKDATE